MAVIPNKNTKQARKILDKQGVTAVEYRAGDRMDRLEKANRAVEYFGDVRFSKSPRAESGSKIRNNEKNDLGSGSQNNLDNGRKGNRNAKQVEPRGFQRLRRQIWSYIRGRGWVDKTPTEQVSEGVRQEKRKDILRNAFLDIRGSSGAVEADGGEASQIQESINAKEYAQKNGLWIEYKDVRSKLRTPDLTPLPLLYTKSIHKMN